jgi:hypothetical protein
MKWEYKAIKTQLGSSAQTGSDKIGGLSVTVLRDVDVILNELGKDAWELVSVQPTADLELWMCFKRPLEEH